MPSDWLCQGCDATNRGRSEVCENCGAARPKQDRVSERESGPSACPFDGAPLHANGWCPAGDGFPITRACPFVCDRCRCPLTWSGTCLSCDCYAPGDRYDYEAPGKPGGGHWRMVEKGPFVILPPAEQAAMAREFRDTVRRLVMRHTLQETA